MQTDPSSCKTSTAASLAKRQEKAIGVASSIQTLPGGSSQLTSDLCLVSTVCILILRWPKPRDLEFLKRYHYQYWSVASPLCSPPSTPSSLSILTFNPIIVSQFRGCQTIHPCECILVFLFYPARTCAKGLSNRFFLSVCLSVRPSGEKF